VSCGSCPTGQKCNASNLCETCVPATCASLGLECGSASDGCGKYVSCGSCTTNTRPFCLSDKCYGSSVCDARMTFLGSCLRKITSTGATSSCIEYYDSFTSGTPQAYIDSCASSGTLTATWRTTTCSRTGSVGGCESTSASGSATSPWCVRNLVWYFPPSTQSSVQSSCAGGGQRYVSP
jgi:hypothetical protein